MHRKFLIFLLLIPIFACKGKESSPQAEQAEVAPALTEYTLHVRFEGLIAFADRVIGGDPVLWALLPDADYVPESAIATDLPPCVLDERPRPTATQLRMHFPPHQAALRFEGAQVTLDGVRIDGLVPFVSIAGQDLRFSTGKTKPSMLHDRLASKEEVESATGQRVDSLDKVGSAFVAEGLIDPTSVPFLSARALIDFGDKLDAKPIMCGNPPQPISYGFRLPGNLACTPRSPVQLAETVEVLQERLTHSIKITLHPRGGELVVQPATPGADVTIRILNIRPRDLVEPLPDCDTVGTHLEVYRWFYRLLAAPEDCSIRHFFPCIPAGNFGGNKCPEKGFTG